MGILTAKRLMMTFIQQDLPTRAEPCVRVWDRIS